MYLTQLGWEASKHQPKEMSKNQSSISTETRQLLNIIQNKMKSNKVDKIKVKRYEIDEKLKRNFQQT